MLIFQCVAVAELALTDGGSVAQFSFTYDTRVPRIVSRYDLTAVDLLYTAHPSVDVGQDLCANKVLPHGTFDIGDRYQT